MSNTLKLQTPPLLFNCSVSSICNVIYTGNKTSISTGTKPECLLPTCVSTVFHRNGRKSQVCRPTALALAKLEPKSFHVFSATLLNTSDSAMETLRELPFLKTSTAVSLSAVVRAVALTVTTTKIQACPLQLHYRQESIMESKEIFRDKQHRMASLFIYIFTLLSCHMKMLIQASHGNLCLLTYCIYL